MMKFFKKMTCATIFSGGLAFGENNGGLSNHDVTIEVDETSLLQKKILNSAAKCATFEVSGSVLTAHNGRYLHVDGVSRDGADVWRLDSDHEIYRFKGVWRVAHYQVDRFYLASGRAQTTPPEGHWSGSSGTASVNCIRQRHVPGDMAALEILLADAENDALIAHQDLVGAFVPLAKIEAGTINTMDTLTSVIKDQFVTHTFVRPFAAVPVVVAVMSSAGHHPAEVRIFDVTKEEFKVTVVEPEGHTDGPHKSERVDFMAVVPGVHEIYGLRVEAGLTSTNATVTNKKAFGHAGMRSMWQTLGWNFASTPALFVSLNSINNDQDCFERGKHISSPWMTASSSHVSKIGAKISLERSEVADDSIVAEEEDIAWIAVQQGTPVGAEVVLTKKMGSGERLGFADAQKGKKAWLTTKDVDPICVVSKSSRYGNNGGWPRIFERKKNQVCVAIDEDMKTNIERLHVREDISMITFPKAFSTCLEAGCCTSATDCRVKMALAARKAVIFANREKWIVSIKTRILNLEKSLLEQAANSAAHKEREVKRKAAWEQARLDNLAAQALLKLRKTECAAAFPGKKKIGQLPADMSSLLETFEDVYTFTDCKLRCCIPAESSPSVACASVIHDADAALCFTMSDAYVNPLKGVAGPPIFAAAYERNRGAEAAS